MLNFKTPGPGATTARIKTSFGEIRVLFFPEVAPKAVENFTTHAENGYYNGHIFHRVIRGFMIQGGDPTGTGRGGESIWGGVFKNEVSGLARNFRGALAMANAGPDTNGSQFYIVQAGNEGIDASVFRQMEAQSGEAFPDEAKAKYLEVGGAPWLDGGYTVFGQVIEGIEVIDKIATVPTARGDKPVTPVKIESVTVETL